MNLLFVTDPSLAKLRREVGQNLARYSEPNGRPWFTEAAGATGIRETGIQVGELRPLLDPDGNTLNDLENAKTLYEDLRSLTPIQATDERLWALLSHPTYWNYMQKRWSPTARQKEKPERFILDRYFFSSHGTGGLVRNGISRLWWFGYLTFEAKRSDPFELTRVLLSSQDIQTGILQRSFGRSRYVRSATLSFFGKKHTEIEKIGAKRGGLGKVVQHLVLSLNMAGGVYLLDALEESQLHSILDASLQEFAA